MLTMSLVQDVTRSRGLAKPVAPPKAGGKTDGDDAEGGKSATPAASKAGPVRRRVVRGLESSGARVVLYMLFVLSVFVVHITYGICVVAIRRRGGRRHEEAHDTQATSCSQVREASLDVVLAHGSDTDWPQSGLL